MHNNVILKCTIRPRIHVTLVSMNYQGYRINGGVGFSVNKPTLRINFTKTNSFTVLDKREHGFSGSEISRIISCLEKIKEYYKFDSSLSVELNGEMKTHHGFGSGTSARLAIIEALFLINNKSVTKEELVRLSGRGGTSGVGISTYFSGGFIADVGRKSDGVTLFPSFLCEDRTSLPLKFLQFKMPTWQIGLCLPKGIHALTEKEEKEFFNNTCPIESHDVFEANYHVTYGLCASALENDFDNFCMSINNIQNCKWKNEEINLYGKRITDIRNSILSLGAEAVGMSSLGPLIYFFGNNIDEIIYNYERNKDDCIFYSANISNSGRKFTKC